MTGGRSRRTQRLLGLFQAFLQSPRRSEGTLNDILDEISPFNREMALKSRVQVDGGHEKVLRQETMSVGVVLGWSRFHALRQTLNVCWMHIEGELGHA